MEFGDFKNAITQFEKSREHSFTPMETHFKLGECLINLKKYNEALEIFQRIENSEKIIMKTTTSVGGKTTVRKGHPIEQKWIDKAKEFIKKISSIQNEALS